MSLIKKVRFFCIRLGAFLSSPMFRNSIMVAFVFFFSLGFLFNTYAYDPLEIFPEVREFKEMGSVPGNNLYLTLGNEQAGQIITLQDIINPGAHDRWPEIVGNPNISASAKLGLLGIADTSTTALLYSPPHVDVVEHLAQEWVPNYKESQHALYAASGYEQLQSLNLHEIWGITRNLAYMFFVITFIVAGFMIMFRHKLGGQVMVSVYNTLPSIVVSLVLVTFSFAIVGFMMDIGVLFQEVISGIMNLERYMNITNPASMWWRFIADGFMMDIRGSGGIDMSFKGVFGRALGALLGGGLTHFFTGNSIPDLLILLVASIIVLFAVIKIFITLLKAYVGIILQTIAAPIVIAVSTIPGRRGLLGDWFKTVAKHVLTFVLVFLIVHIPIYFMHLVDINYWDIFSVGLGRDRSVIAEEAGDIFGRSRFVYACIAIYCFFLAANVPKMLDEFLPLTRGRGGNLAAEGVREQMRKIPGVGGFFK